MRKLRSALTDFFHKGDLLLLLFCVLASIFGIVVIASATHYMGTNRQIVVQSAALLIGVLVFVVFSLLDAELLTEHRWLLLVFCYVFILLLLPLGSNRNGNRAWLSLRILPFDVQPAEICKIPFILVLAKTMSLYQNRLSSLRCIVSLTVQLLVMLLLILVVTRDAGTALVYLFIFLIMLLLSGMSGWAMLGGFGGAAGVIAALLAVYAFLYRLVNGRRLDFTEKLLRQDQLDRIRMIFDPTVDPTGQGVRWDTNRSIAMLSGGGVSGQGLFGGFLTQSGSISAQHTDFIFSAIGEELGLLGCIFTLLLILAVIVRCVWVGQHSSSFMSRLICHGIAAMLVFQTLVNVGMCIGVMPVIGLTLPFISYGGSSLITLFAAMGIVSGIHMRPDPEAASPYVSPRY